MKTKNKNIFKKIPWYGWVGAIIFIVFQIGLYKLGGWMGQNLMGKVWSICPEIEAIDSHIPFAPWFFIQIYFLAYASWFIVPLIISTGKKEDFINFMIYGTIASLIGFLLFVFVPTWQDRTKDIADLSFLNNTPFTKWLIETIRAMDGGDKAWNLCPSYHCMASALCAFGVLGIKKHHWFTQTFIGVFGILVCMSTVLVKQHYFIDIVGGVSVALVPFVITRFMWKPGQRIMINNPLFLNTKHLTKKDVVKAEEANEVTPAEKKEELKTGIN